MKQYRFLKTVIFLSKLVAVFVLVGGFLISADIKGPSSFFSLVGSILSALFLFASGEMLKLFIDIADNVEKMADR